MLQIHRRLIVLTKTNGHCEFILLPEALCQCNAIPHAAFVTSTLMHYVITLHYAFGNLITE